MGNKQHSRQ